MYKLWWWSKEEMINSTNIGLENSREALLKLSLKNEYICPDIFYYFLLELSEHFICTTFIKDITILWVILLFYISNSFCCAWQQATWGNMLRKYSHAFTYTISILWHSGRSDLTLWCGFLLLCALLWHPRA